MLEDRALADIAALADGTLPESRRAEVEARVAESPELREALAAQRAALSAIEKLDDDAPGRLSAWVRALGPAVPPKPGRLERLGARRHAEPLRDGIGSTDPDGLDAESADHREGFAVRLRQRAAREPRGQGRGRGERRPALREGFSTTGLGRRMSMRTAAAIAAVSLAAIALAVMLTSDAGEDAPSLEKVAAVADQPADRPAPDREPGSGELVFSLDGIAWPDWSRGAGWRPAGARRDEIDDRATATVVYQRRRRRVAYTIVARPQLELPADGRRVKRGDTTYVLTSLGGRRAVVWHRDGRTCILSGRGVTHRSLLRLAAYDSAAASRARARYRRVPRVDALISSSRAASA